EENEIPLTRAEVERMKRKADGCRRLIIAYLSVGETAKYRYYWQSQWSKQRPAWIGKENKQWLGNYVVQYWRPIWQDIIFGSPDSFVDRILRAGFDGFFIDRADAYYYFGDTKKRREQMRDFIIRLTNYVRAKQNDAIILVQN